MKTKYTIDYFIKKFRAIPERKWITGRYGDGKGNHCALGFCGNNIHKPWTDEAQALVINRRKI